LEARESILKSLNLYNKFAFLYVTVTQLNC